MKGLLKGPNRSTSGKEGVVTWKKKEGSQGLKYSHVRLRLKGIVIRTYSTRPVTTAPVRMRHDESHVANACCPIAYAARRRLPDDAPRRALYIFTCRGAAL